MKKSVQLESDNLLEQFYSAIVNDRLGSVHIPHSSVMYIRAAIEADTGVRYSLSHIEKAMELEGINTYKRKGVKNAKSRR